MVEKDTGIGWRGKSLLRAAVEGIQPKLYQQGAVEDGDCHMAGMRKLYVLRLITLENIDMTDKPHLAKSSRSELQFQESRRGSGL